MNWEKTFVFAFTVTVTLSLAALVITIGTAVEGAIGALK